MRTQPVNTAVFADPSRSSRYLRPSGESALACGSCQLRLTQSLAEFSNSLQSLRPAFPLMENDSNVEMVNQFLELSGAAATENHSLNLQNLMVLSNVFDFPPAFSENGWGVFASECPNSSVVSNPAPCIGVVERDNKKRKAPSVSESSSGNSSAPVSENTSRQEEKTNKRRNSSGRGKRSTEKVVEKPEEVIHVRARRGQATDSHSLAERVRREKINKRIRCLKDLVPGCYKTMGMAVMLDEIINYVQSLQNQVEFLSMKISAASSFYDFNSDTDAMGASQVLSQSSSLHQCLLDQRHMIDMERRIGIDNHWPGPNGL